MKVVTDALVYQFSMAPLEFDISMIGLRAPSELDSERPLAFGHFQLDMVQRVLFRRGEVVQLRRRAMDMLVLLVQNAGETVSKREFIKRIWGKRVVEDVALRVHIATLRKALKDGQEGYRYIGTMAGRGYRFTAPVRRAGPVITAITADQEAAPSTDGATAGGTVIRGRAASPRVVGRAQVVEMLVRKLEQSRLVSIVGPGGIGKSTVAAAIVEALRDTYPHGAHVVDLAALSEPGGVASAVGSALVITGYGGDSVLEVSRYLQGRSLLLVLDHCERQVEATARLVGAVLESCPGVRILTTSREPLHLPDEWVHRLQGLSCPEPGRAPTAARLHQYSALELFVARARAHLQWDVADTEMEQVAQVCRRLDGNPLAIEIVAARVDTFGVQGLWEHLRGTALLLMNGLRTSPPRQQTLQATFDWTYELLPPEEQTLFRRLAVFNGSFSQNDVAGLVPEQPYEEAEAMSGYLLNLCTKSLVVAQDEANGVSYRLLETTRAYARDKLSASKEELAETRRRHLRVCVVVGMHWLWTEVGHGGQWLAQFNRYFNDFRAALRLSQEADSGVGVADQLRLCLVWFEAVVAAECPGRNAFDEQTRAAMAGSQAELLRVLDSLTDAPAADAALVRRLTFAHWIALDGARRRAFSGSVWLEQVIHGQRAIAIYLSQAFLAAPTFQAGADARFEPVAAVSHLYAGELSMGRRYAERSLGACEQMRARVQRAALSVHPLTVLARALWLQGQVEQGLQRAAQAVAEARICGVSMLVCVALRVEVSLLLVTGHIARACTGIELLREYARLHGIEYQQLWADCLSLVSTIMLGDHTLERPLVFSHDTQDGVEFFDNFGFFHPSLVTPEAIVRAQSGLGGWLTAELLRVKAERLLVCEEGATTAEVEAVLQQALQIARQQSALVFELRIAASLARLWSSQDCAPKAYVLLAEVYGRFTEGFGATDLRQARLLLEELAARDNTVVAAPPT